MFSDFLKKNLYMISHPAWTRGHKVAYIILEDQLEAKRKNHLPEIGDKDKG
jgi:hypothetical protein